ncbi:patatin-like phospholipase-domain-containing protein [Podospora fimiseda]|uniref:Patatin-like phospholipase-domain-containing protein n=1 Tax=Podospora fimiseda TaxID=252190 RepID=A0AAN7BTI4_9PEZI|nr:patatin-like phospholipase-domain-containing protein [Podospora fimiseda]
MVDVASRAEPPGLPRASSSFRTRATPRRVPTTHRVTIAIPSPSPTSNVTSTSARSPASVVRSPELNVTSTPWSKKLILTLDGGGIKGYASLITLQALMEEIAKVEKERSPSALSSAHTDRIPRDKIPNDVYREGQYLPCHYFDYIAGTSVGGLIAIMLGMQGNSAEDCIKEFHRQNKAIPLTDLTQNLPALVELPLLYRRSTWPTKRTREFFETFAKFSVTSTAASRNPPSPSIASSFDSVEFRKDSYQCQTLAWCTEVEPHRARRPYAFCTYKEEDANPSLVSIPEVAKAITTPSSYSFKPFKLGSGQFVDGSKEIRDPTLEVLKEISALLDNTQQPSVDLLLSLGTDEHHTWFYEKIIFRSSTRPHRSSFAASQQSVLSEEGKSYNQYHRFEVPGIKLGLKRRYYLREIEEATKKWLEDDQQKVSIRRYAELLVDRRRERAETVRWETFALGVRYICQYEGCKDKDNKGRGWGGRGDFYDHLERRHDLMKRAERGKVRDVEEELDAGRTFGFGL